MFYKGKKDWHKRGHWKDYEPDLEKGPRLRSLSDQGVRGGLHQYESPAMQLEVLWLKKIGMGLGVFVGLVGVRR